MSLTSVLVTAVCLVVGYVWFRRRPDSRLPPFPVRPLPILGNLLNMKSDMRSLFKAWREQCGDIFSLYMGGTLVVTLNGFDLLKEALVKNADAFSDRPLVYFDKATGVPQKGVIFASGKSWKEQRAVALAILRTFGMGKNILAEKILTEVTSFTTFLSGLKGKPTNIQIMISVCMSNIVCSILFGRRFEYDDAELQAFIKALRTMVAETQNISLINYFPWLEYFPGDLFRAKTLASSSTKMMEILNHFMETTMRENKDADSINNFIAAYILEMKKQVVAGQPTSMDKENLSKIMLDLFEAGTDTPSTTINWCLLYMVVYPDVQEKVYQEIIDKVGTERTPTMQDKIQLPYVNAVIMETQRLASVVPLSLTHLCSEEVTLRGYTIPKGTYILPNLDSVLHDPITWGEDAMSFRPERFIDDNGKLKTPEEFIPYSIGRRICLAEALAKMELFLFLSFMIQKFQFLPADPRKPPSLDYIIGFVTSTVPFEVIIEERLII